MTIADTARNLLALAERAQTRSANVKWYTLDNCIKMTATQGGGEWDGEYVHAASPDAIAALCKGYLEAERDAERIALLGTQSWFMRALTCDDTPLDPARIGELRALIDAIAACAIAARAIATRGAT